MAGATLATSWAAAPTAAPATLTAARMNDMPHRTTLHLNLTPMPTGTVSTGFNADGSMFVQVIATDFTPGSAHWVDVFANGEANGQVRQQRTLPAARLRDRLPARLAAGGAARQSSTTRR